MTLEALLNDYAAFNLWANTEMVTWLKSKPLKLMESEVPSSFPNLKLTLLHIWSAEDVWLQRLKKIASPIFLTNTFNGSTEDVFEGILKSSQEFSEYVKNVSAKDLEEICDFRLLNGTEDSRPRVYMIQHCMNHSTYHRGQIVTIARKLGLSDPPSTDFMRYIRVKQS